jgi:hypothetical protein
MLNLLGKLISTLSSILWGLQITSYGYLHQQLYRKYSSHVQLQVHARLFRCRLRLLVSVFFFPSQICEVCGLPRWLWKFWLEVIGASRKHSDSCLLEVVLWTWRPWIFSLIMWRVRPMFFTFCTSFVFSPSS